MMHSQLENVNNNKQYIGSMTGEALNKGKGSIRASEHLKIAWAYNMVVQVLAPKGNVARQYLK